MTEDHFPCSVCNKTVRNWNNALLCDLCSNWVHIKCNKLDKKGYDYHDKNPDAHFSCLKCLENNIPFTTLDNNQFNLYVKLGVNYICNEFNVNYAPRVRDQKLFIGVNQTMYNSIYNINNNIDDDDNEDNIEINMNCKYYGTEDFIQSKFKEEKHFSVFHLNIHSIERHIEELRVVLQMLNHKFDLICISESKIQSGNTPKVNLNIDGYQTPVGTPTEAKKGGVLIYVKEGINYKPRPDLNIYKQKELESYFVEIINPNEKNSIVGVIYRHPCMNPQTFNDEYLKPLTTKLGKENRTTYLTGDFNLDLLKTSNHAPTFDFLEIMMTQLILPSITIPTRMNPINNSLIDNIMTNNIHPNLKSGNLTIGISDHLPSFIVVPRKNQSHLPKKHNLYKRDTKNFDRENFILDFLQIDWDKELSNNVNEAAATFFQLMNVLIDRYIPLKKITQKEYKRKYKPWITDIVVNKIKEKNNILSKITKCKDQTRKEELKNQFKALKNEVTQITRTNKKNYYENYFTKHKDNLS